MSINAKYLVNGIEDIRKFCNPFLNKNRILMTNILADLNKGVNVSKTSINDKPLDVRQIKYYKSMLNKMLGICDTLKIEIGIGL